MPTVLEAMTATTPIMARTVIFVTSEFPLWRNGAKGKPRELFGNAPAGGVFAPLR